MKTRMLLVLVAALVSGSNVFGDTIAYTDGGSPGNHVGAGGTPLNIGREFTVTGAGITVTSLGIYDEDASGNELPLTHSHAVTLFSIGATGVGNPSNTEIATTTIFAGTDPSYASGFAFAPITRTYLAPGNYAVIAYDLNDGNDGYGDGGGRLSSPNANDAGFDPYEFTTNASPAFPGGGDGNDHNGASFMFENGKTLPEPSSVVALVGLAVMGLVAVARRRRKA